MLAAICLLIAIRRIVTIRTESLIIVATKTIKRSEGLPRKRNRLANALLTASLAALSGFSASGCHRAYYRKQADQEVNCLIQEKSSHLARRPNGDLGISVDRRSRMFNPFDVDFEPMPMDDPASHQYMQCVDGRRGYPMWDAAGFTNAVENPDWWQFLPLDEDGVLVLNNDNAVRIALLHSPGYQRQLEQLYLSALDVSSERFIFDTQFFGNASAEFDVQGPERAGGQLTRIGGGKGLSMRRNLATGGTILAGVANDIVWQLSGPNTQSASTILDFTFLQPLLRGAGRDRVLERLTLSERRLLANVRNFERYRRSFYLNITIGRGIEGTVSRSAEVFGGEFAGLGGGTIAVAGGTFVPQAGGFLGLLQDRLQIKNLEENIARLGESLLILDNTLIELLTTIPDDPEEILRQRLQVAQQQSALLDAQSGLISQQTAYQASVDTFLNNLGLPTYICTRIEDPFLDRYQLIDEDLRSRREELIKLRTAVGELNIELLGETVMEIDPATGLPTASMKWSPKVRDTLARLQTQLEPLQDFMVHLETVDADRVLSDIAQLVEALPERIKSNDRLINLYESERDSMCTLLEVDKIDQSIFDITELSTLNQELESTFSELMERVTVYKKQLQSINQSLETYFQTGAGDATETEIATAIRENLVLATQDLLSELGDDVLTLQLIQARARTESALLPEVEITAPEAFEIARRNRRDWANARASLVDSWRLIEFNADNLESNLDLRFDGDVLNDGNNPFSLRSKTASFRVGLQWDAPITRLQERNTYRQSLIEFARAKRSYYQYEDGIWRLVRGQIRQLQANQFTFEYGRQSVRIAASQIQLNEDIRELRDSRGLGSGPTAARDTISALAALRSAQNALLNIYVNYEVVRRNIQFDIGTMELTPEGIWIDDGVIDPDYLLTLPGTTAQALPGGACSDCGIRIRNQPQPPEYGAIYIQDSQMLEIDQVNYLPQP